jgi:hypothetical protein
VVAHAFNPSTREAEAGRFLSLKPAWSTKWVPGHPGLYRKTLSRKTKKKKKKKRFFCQNINCFIESAYAWDENFLNQFLLYSFEIIFSLSLMFFNFTRVSSKQIQKIFLFLISHIMECRCVLSYGLWGLYCCCCFVLLVACDFLFSFM